MNPQTDCDPLDECDRGNPLAAVLADVDRPGEQLLHQFCADFGRSMHEAVEVFAWIDEHARPAHTADVEDALKRMNDNIKQHLSILVAYQQKQELEAPRELRMSTCVMALALGYNNAANARTPAELARKLGVSKATVNKCLNHFLARTQLSALPGQRSAAARATMRAARKKQCQTL